MSNQQNIICVKIIPINIQLKLITIMYYIDYICFEVVLKSK